MNEITNKELMEILKRKDEFIKNQDDFITDLISQKERLEKQNALLELSLNECMDDKFPEEFSKIKNFSIAMYEVLSKSANLISALKDEIEFKFFDFIYCNNYSFPENIEEKILKLLVEIKKL